VSFARTVAQPTDATLDEMKQRGTFFVPTLAVMSPLGDPQGNSADDVALQLVVVSGAARGFR